MALGWSALTGLNVLGADKAVVAAPAGEAVATSISGFLTNAPVLGEAVRFRVRGVVTHSTSDKTFFIQEGGSGVYVFHRPAKALAVGELVEVVANPSLGGVVPTLQNCEVTVLGTAPAPAAAILTSAEAMNPTNAMKLAQISGILQRHRLTAGRTLLLNPRDGGPVFEVDAEALKDLDLLDQLQPGSLLAATGIVAARKGPDGKIASVRLLIRSQGDVVVLQGPPFWNAVRVGEAAALAVLALGIALAWVILLRREVRRQTGIIAQRFEREAALRASEDRFQKVFRATPDVLVIARASDEKIVDVNPAFERITGYSKTESVGRSTKELGLYADPQSRIEILGQFKEGGPVANTYFEARRKSGEPIWFLASMEWIEWNGEKCWLSAARDITDQKLADDHRRQLEAQLHQSQKMEALGTMAGGIAHDFNNFLAAILANVELATDDSRLPIAHVQHNLDGIRAAALRAKNLVNQIQTFSRKASQNKRAILLDSVLNESVRLLQAIAPASIQFETRVRPDCPPVLADPDVMLQVIVNLGTNGSQAMKGRPGTVLMTLEPFTVDAALARANPKLNPGLYLRLTVKDDGEGMEAKTVQRIFDPFFTTKAPGKGTGLGLSITHSAVSSHGGTITVETAPGAGSTFSVYLPAASASVGSTPPPRVENSFRRGSGEPILVVDDDTSLIAATEHMLKRLGYNVTALTNPVEAAYLLQNEPNRFRLLLSDLNMPMMSGLDLLAHLRRGNPDLPVIIFSGYITEEHQAQTKSDPCLRFLSKPATMSDLSEAISAMLSRNSEASEKMAGSNAPLAGNRVALPTN